MSTHPSIVLLNRQLSCKDNNPFSLVLDSLAQSSYFLFQEFAYKLTCPITYLSFETTEKPEYAKYFMDCSEAGVKEIKTFLLNVSNSSVSKMAIFIDSLNYLHSETLASFISDLVEPRFSIFGCFHKDCPTSATYGYPEPINLLSYIASAIYEVGPLHMDNLEEYERKISRFEFQINKRFNSHVFKLHLTSRRKSGKSSVSNYIVDSLRHCYEVDKQESLGGETEDEKLLENLTTFNLTTSSKQKLAREQVELPFMEAQTELGKFGGAIVYEFEKDDDYDEEDPYEDPF